MKMFAAVAVLITAVTSVSAMTRPDQEIVRYLGAEKAATLTRGQTVSILNVIHSGDSESDKFSKVHNIARR